MDKEQLLQIIELSKRKDHIAFKKLVEYYQSYAFSLAFRLVCNEDEAKDIVQDGFIRVWKHLSKFKTDTKFTTWLYKIIYNLSLDKIKTGKRRMVHMLNPNENLLELEKFMSDNPEKQIANKDLADIIEILAEELTPKQRAVFILRDLQGAEMDEISDITSMSKGAVKSNLYYARLNIREKLEKIETIKKVYHEMQ